MAERQVTSSSQLSEENYIRELYILLRTTNDSLLHLREKELAPHGISTAQSAALITIYSLGEEATPIEISRWMFREPHTISVLLSRMEKSGLLKKSPFPNSNKMIKITLTEKGYQAYLNAINMRSILNIISNLSKKKQQQLFSLLDFLRTNTIKALAFNETSANRRLKYVPESDT